MINHSARPQALVRDGSHSCARKLRARPRSWTCAALLIVVACGGNPGPSLDPSMTDPSVAGVLVIEQFLRAANASELERMAELHGSMAGPISTLYPPADVQRRMQLMATILRHQNYQVLDVEPVPARRGEAWIASVEMTLQQRTVNVPFTLVWTGNSWLIECVEVVRITGEGGGTSCG